ncbi:tripartite tricarboxylate transporter substrate binding protein [Paenibacillus xerothermodurans]|uniref:Tripartite tricarboxylate transporter substrate binding protein n=2 Tax=Paenibacillus xerothermodurans TaxID=1977292 RepID=A0A2W1NN08_PAEXE|nr:tripartite tricarboxylate transporter substrate binding protein [Paenibacillus xerothermodurans]
MLSGCSHSAQADDINYPTRQIEYVVPFAPGGGVDLVARTVAEYLSKKWNQPISVVNKPGGGGAVGAQAVLQQSAKDGYTVLADNNSSTSMLAAGAAKPPVGIEEHLLVSRVVEDAAAFAVSEDAPWKDFNEFCDWVRANPEQLSWTSVGPAGFSSFAVAEWTKAIGADLSRTKMVATKGASDSVPMIAGGHAVLAVHTVAELYPLAKAGKIRLLAVVSDKRSPYFPDVPTADEQGVKGLTVQWWTGISMPAGTPPAIREKWDKAVSEMVEDPAFVEKLKMIQVEPGYLNSNDFESFLKKETEYYTEIAAKAGIRK